MKIELKKVKTHAGNETLWINAEVWLDGNYAATVSDNGNGGMHMWHWANTVIRDGFEAYVKTLPKHKVVGSAYVITPDEDSVFDSCLAMHELAKKCKKNVLYRKAQHETTVWQVGFAPHSCDTIVAYVRAKHPNAVIYNELLAKGENPEHLPVTDDEIAKQEAKFTGWQKRRQNEWSERLTHCRAMLPDFITVTAEPDSEHNAVFTNTQTGRTKVVDAFHLAYTCQVIADLFGTK
jgi:hypothetical protein